MTASHNNVSLWVTNSEEKNRYQQSGLTFLQVQIIRKFLCVCQIIQQNLNTSLEEMSTKGKVRESQTWARNTAFTNLIASYASVETTIYTSSTAAQPIAWALFRTVCLEEEDTWNELNTKLWNYSETPLKCNMAYLEVIVTSVILFSVTPINKFSPLPSHSIPLPSLPLPYLTLPYFTLPYLLILLARWKKQRFILTVLDCLNHIESLCTACFLHHIHFH